MLLCSEILQYITDNMSAEAVMFSPCPTVCSNVFAIVLCQHGLVHRADWVGSVPTWTSPQSRRSGFCANMD